MFASDDARGFWNTDKNNFQPRLGFAYKWNDKTVIRGGWGIYTAPFIFSNGINQMGYSQSTPITATPGSRPDVPVDAEQPVSARHPAAGRQLASGRTRSSARASTGSRRSTFNNGQLSRYLVNVQRELPGQWLLEVGYVGSHGYDLTTERRVEQRPGAVPVDEPGRATRRRSTSSARRCPTRSPACCRPASPAPTSRARSCCGRSRSSTTSRPTNRTAAASTTRRR